MSRGHRALELLRTLLEEFDKQPGIVHAMLRCRPEAKFVDQARELVRAAADADAQSGIERGTKLGDYCWGCDAIHPPAGEPESHGRRRS